MHLIRNELRLKSELIGTGEQGTVVGWGVVLTEWMERLWGVLIASAAVSLITGTVAGVTLVLGPSLGLHAVWTGL